MRNPGAGGSEETAGELSKLLTHFSFEAVGSAGVCVGVCWCVICTVPTASGGAARPSPLFLNLHSSSDLHLMHSGIVWDQREKICLLDQQFS